jgi:hypothetical protein
MLAVFVAPAPSVLDREHVLLVLLRPEVDLDTLEGVTAVAALVVADGQVLAVVDGNLRRAALGTARAEVLDHRLLPQSVCAPRVHLAAGSDGASDDNALSEQDLALAGNEKGRCLSDIGPIFCMTRSRSGLQRTHSVRRLRIQPTRPVPSTPSRIAPGAGVNFMFGASK